MAAPVVLGQVAPAATTNTTVFTADEPGFAQVLVCNRGAATTYRVALRKAGVTLADQHYLVYDAPLRANESRPVPFRVAYDVGDVLTVYSDSGSVSFTACGVKSP